MQSSDLAGGHGGHAVLVSRQGEGGVHDPPITLQGNVPAADQSELSSVTSTNHGSPGHNTHPLDQSEVSIVAS